MIAQSKTYEVHPLAEIFPEIEGPAFDALVEDIEKNGQQSAAALYEGKLLDGKNRYRACQKLGKELIAKPYEGNDPIGFVLSINLYRRHLDESQRAMVAARLTKFELGANQHSKGEGPSIEGASKLLNVGHASVERAKKVLNSGDAEIIKAVEQGEQSVSNAANEVAQQNGGKGKRGKGKGGKGNKSKASKDKPPKTTIEYITPRDGKTALNAYSILEEHLLDALQDVNDKSSFTHADEYARRTIEKLEEKVGDMQPTEEDEQTEEVAA